MLCFTGLELFSVDGQGPDNLAPRNSHLESYTVKQDFSQTHTENQIHNLADTKHCYPVWIVP